MVRPVELQDMLAKAPAAEKVAQTQKAAAENDQRQAMLTVAHKAQTAQRQPVPTPAGDEVILHRDAADENKKKKKDEQPDSHSPAGTEEDADSDDDVRPDVPTHLDVTG